MSLQARTKKILALVVAVALIAAIAVVGIVWKLAESAEPSSPVITAYAAGDTVDVAPWSFCNLYLEDCEAGEIVRMTVPTGYPVQLSLPSEIADAPWRMYASFVDVESGLQLEESVLFAPGERSAVTVGGEPNLQLMVIEIQLPSATVDELGDPIARAVWAVHNDY